MLSTLYAAECLTHVDTEGSGFTRVAARRLADPLTVGLCPKSFDQSVALRAVLVATGVSRQLPRQDLHL